MDAILSLPVLSLFLIPTVSSYSTSLNLVFFYMTWTTLVLSHPPLRVELFGTVIVRLLFYILPSLLFFLFDILTPSAAVVVKAQGEAGLPTGSKRGKIRLKELKVAGWALFNLALGFAVQAGVETIRTKMFGLRSALKVSMTLPMPGEMVKDLARGALTREVSDKYAARQELGLLTINNRCWYTLSTAISFIRRTISQPSTTSPGTMHCRHHFLSRLTTTIHSYTSCIISSRHTHLPCFSASTCLPSSSI